MRYLAIPLKPNDSFKINSDAYDQIAKVNMGIDVRFMDAYNSDQTMPFHLRLTNNFLTRVFDYQNRRGYYLSFEKRMDDFGRYSLVNNPYEGIIKPILHECYAPNVVSAIGRKLAKALLLEESGVSSTVFTLAQTELLVNMLHKMALASYAKKHRQILPSRQAMDESVLAFHKIMSTPEAQKYAVQDRTRPGNNDPQPGL